ncbi:MAG: HAMP domain-containing protein, partial [Hungatella sp.]
MMRTIRNIKFKYKIILLSATMIILTSLLTGIFYYEYVSKDIVENYRLLSEDLVAQSNQLLDNELQMLNNKVYAILSNSTFNKTLGNYLVQFDDSRITHTMGIVADSLTELIRGDAFIASAYLYTEKHEFDSFLQLRNYNFDFKKSIFYQVCEKDSVNIVYWFPAMKDEIFLPGEMVVPIVYKFKVDGASSDQYLVINLKQSELMKYIVGNAGSMDKLFVVNQKGETIISSGEEDRSIVQSLLQLEQEGSETTSRKISYQGKDYQAVYATVKANGWKIFGLKSYAELLKNTTKIRNFIFLISFAMVVLSIVLLAILAHELTASLDLLVESMNQAREGDFDTHFSYPYQDEVGKLAVSFNYMLDEIQ